jgi:hypothetical protein
LTTKIQKELLNHKNICLKILIFGIFSVISPSETENNNHIKVITTMDLTGKIIAVLEPRGGVSNRTGNAWKSQDFVIEVPGQYPKRCVFTVFGEDRLNQFNIQMGDDLTVSFDIDAHEYNGRWFNDIRAYSVVRGSAAPVAAAPVAGVTPFPPQQVAPAAPFPPAQEPAGEGSADDLPF